tara:strand:- start:4632 stop:4751 length:120 start_codon:yes stop_codon:yes gene_type:complete
MSIETWLAISLFINFCYGVETINREIKKYNEDKIKNKNK